MKLSVITITPKIAKSLLEHNTGNRNMLPSNVAYWSAALRGKAVTLTHQGVAITGTLANPKRLIDGQHRLKACVETGISFQSVFAEESPEISFGSIDAGTPRTIAFRAEIATDLSQLANKLWLTGFGGAHVTRAPISAIKEIAEIIEPFAANIANLKVRRLSPVSFRLAFLLQEKTYGYNFSRAFQMGEFEILPESLKALYRRQTTNPLEVTGQGNAAMGVYVVWKAIHTPNAKRILTFNGDVCGEVKTIVFGVFPEIFQIWQKYQPGKA